MACKNTTENCQEGIPIPSSVKDVDTGIDLIAGKTYAFSAKGNWCDWYDISDANGKPSNTLKKWLEKKKRVPAENWFCLIGYIDPKKPFPIGTENKITMTESGRLFCFANDLPNMYWNNSGCVCLTVREIVNAGG